MQISCTKAKMTATTLVIALLMASTALMVMPAQAQLAPQQPVAGPLPTGVTPSITLTTEAYLSFRPNPVGVGQTFLVNMWMHPPIHVQRQFIQAFEVTITKPDGTKDVFKMDSYQGDGTAWFEYVADQVGTWKIKFDFLGMYFPAGHYLEAKVYNTSRTVLGVSSVYLDSAYYKPSSDGPYELKVQQEIVYSWPPSPLPTDYWTRPVHPHHREWWPILGNYPPDGTVGGGANWPAKTNKYMSNYEFVPYVQGPNTAHILWKRQEAISGLIGGRVGTVSDVAPGTGFVGTGYPTIIYAGRCYQTVTKPMLTLVNGTYRVLPTSVWQCYDLRTGQVYWELLGQTAPTFIEYHKQGAEVPGAYARAGITVYLTTITAPTATADGRILKYDPYTGAVALNLTGPPPGVTAGTLYAYPFVLSIQTIGTGAAATYRLINWTIENNAGQWRFAGGGAQLTVDNFTARIISNISWPFSSLGTVDYEAGIAVVTAGISHAGTGVSIGQRLMAASLATGSVLWNITTDTSSGLETFFSTLTAVADHGKFAVRMNNGQIWCWDLYSGKILWKSKVSSHPWGTFGAYDVQSAYGLIYSNAYDGVHAIDWETGKIVWTFKAVAPYPYETPYHYEGTSVYAFHGAGKVADGKLYTFSVEHTPTQPITRGDRLYCLNTTTGEHIWNISLSQNVAGSRVFQGGIADGYLVHTSCYDGYLYVFGKGKSATTVTAAPKTVAKGSALLIEGTVLDMSPAQPGTPCVSKESMTAWMEYLHMQLPRPSEVKGVPVTLCAIKSDGTVIDIGTVTTNGFYGTFSCAWTPPEEGTYEIIASFAGDDSYCSSAASTAVTVGSAPEPYPEPVQPEPPIDYTPTITGAAIAIIIAVAIATILILRKKP